MRREIIAWFYREFFWEYVKFYSEFAESGLEFTFLKNLTELPEGVTLNDMKSLIEHAFGSRCMVVSDFGGGDLMIYM